MNNIILLAGAPATGKSYTAKLIKSIFRESKIIALDKFKEFNYDNYGFEDENERDYLDVLAISLFEISIRKLSKENKILILDYPFSYKQINFLDSLVDTNILTITLQCDFDILYERRVSRDNSSERHIGHDCTSYHKESLYNENKIILKEEFKKKLEDSKYDRFMYNKTFCIDTSDYSKINYKKLFEFLFKNLEET